MSDRMSPQREAEIAEHLATTTNWSLGNLAARDLAAELAAVRAERDDCVLVSKQEYEQLEDDSAKLAALEAAGVDNWDGYDDALEAVSR